MSNIVVAYGDGIGPEIMESVLSIMKHARANLKISSIEVGQKIYEKGWESGITDSAWKILSANKVLLKSPITTPQGRGFKSMNVTIRKQLGLYANIRPNISHLKDGHKKVDLVIIRENEEDLYSGIEYRQTFDQYHAIKNITANVSERICSYAFEYAVANNRKKVTCMIKDNIMKLSDGIFHKKFKEIAAKYPNIQSESYIVDIGCARVAKYPERFDVIVTLNLYGDIISDIVAEMIGSIGLAGSINIGDQFAMFEAVHGSAPDIAEKDLANPSGLLNAAVYMLSYLEQPLVAEKIYNAWLTTIKSGIHTADIYKEGHSKLKVGNKDFTQAVIDNLKDENMNLEYISMVCNLPNMTKVFTKQKEAKQLVGVDIYLHWNNSKLNELLAKFKGLTLELGITLTNIMIKGVSIWPEATLATPIETDSLCCRFVSSDKSISTAHITNLLKQLDELAIEYISVEKLYVFNDKNYGFSV